MNIKAKETAKKHGIVQAIVSFFPGGEVVVGVKITIPAMGRNYGDYAEIPEESQTEEGLRSAAQEMLDNVVRGIEEAEG